jgi:hypothetical protein
MTNEHLTCRYNLIEEGTIHTEDLSYEDAIEMEERHSDTFPEIQFWIEPVGNRG